MVNPPPNEDPEWPVVRYITNYMDAMENLPDSLAKLTSRMYQLDANCQNYYREIQEHHDVLASGVTDINQRKQILAKVQNTLGHMQDIGDEKIQLMQTIHDVIEKKARGLDIDLKNSRPRVEQENSVPFNISNANSVSSNLKTSTPNNTEKSMRRGRRTKAGDTSEEPAAAAQAADSSVLSENQSANLPSTSNGVSKQAATNTTTATGKKKQRKSLNNQQNQGQAEAAAAPTSAPAADVASAREDEEGEPLYCVCNGVSFGKMILCDNDACLAEWFHFRCVNLTIKPKGKWYCPSCRGSKPNLPKPKSKFR